MHSTCYAPEDIIDSLHMAKVLPGKGYPTAQAPSRLGTMDQTYCCSHQVDLP